VTGWSEAQESGVVVMCSVGVAQGLAASCGCDMRLGLANRPQRGAPGLFLMADGCPELGEPAALLALLQGIQRQQDDLTRRQGSHFLQKEVSMIQRKIMERSSNNNLMPCLIGSLLRQSIAILFELKIGETLFLFYLYMCRWYNGCKKMVNKIIQWLPSLIMDTNKYRLKPDAKIKSTIARVARYTNARFRASTWPATPGPTPSRSWVRGVVPL
jgi:hypothetical protein